MSSATKTISKNRQSEYLYYIDCILQSRLLLDDDMDFILTISPNSEEEPSTMTLSLSQKLLAGFSITASSILVFYQRHASIAVPISMTPVLFIGAQVMYETVNRRNRKRSVEVLVKTMGNICRLNRAICQYFIDRNTTCSATVVNPYNEILQQLLGMFFCEEVNLLRELRLTVVKIGTQVPPLKDDYAYLNDVKLEDFEIQNVTNIDEAVTFIKKLCDIHVLFVSNSFTCLTAMFCPKIWEDFEVDVDLIVDTYILKIRKLAVKCYNNLSKQFDFVKYYYVKRAKAKEFKPKTSLLPKLSSSDKLYVTTCNMMAQSSHILEKSEAILSKLEENSLKTAAQKDELGKYISDLCFHVYDYYESLSILQKQYEVQAKEVPPHKSLNAESNSESPLVPVEPRPVSVSPIPNETDEDEEYECYVGDNDSTSENGNIYSYEEEESLTYAVMLGQELRQKLRTHAKFISARKKRGLLGDHQEEEIDNNKESKNIELKPVAQESELPTSSPSLCILKPPPTFDDFNKNHAPPPPPPPPMRPLLLDPPVEGEGISSDFSTTLKASLQAFNRSEEVFEDSEDSDNY